jgi:hypothetical protein
MFLFGPMSGFGGDSDTLPPADDMTDALKGFGGMAVTVRFDSGALEVESAGGSSALGLDALYSSDRGADVLETLPDDTAAAIGVGFDEGWVKALADRLSSFAGEDGDQLLKDASDATGLALPADLETLFGRSAALSFSSDFDPETFFNSSDGSDLPLAMKVQGDPEQIQAVLDKIVKGNPQEPDAATLLGTDVDGDTIVIGPNAGYRAQVLAKGTLGQNHVYQDVVRESDQASAVLFVNFDAGDDWLARLAGDDQSVQENVAPLAGFGVTGWSDDDYVHSVLRLTTD